MVFGSLSINFSIFVPLDFGCKFCSKCFFILHKSPYIRLFCMSTETYNTQFSTCGRAPFPFEIVKEYNEKILSFQLAKLDLIIEDGPYQDQQLTSTLVQVLQILNTVKISIAVDESLRSGLIAYFTIGRIRRLLVCLTWDSPQLSSLIDDVTISYATLVIQWASELPLHKDVKIDMQAVLLEIFEDVIKMSPRESRSLTVTNFKFHLCMIIHAPTIYTLEYLQDADLSSLALYSTAISHLEIVLDSASDPLTKELDRKLVSLLDKLVHSEHISVPPAATKINQMLNKHKSWTDTTVLLHEGNDKVDSRNYKHHLNKYSPPWIDIFNEHLEIESPEPEVSVVPEEASVYQPTININHKPPRRHRLIPKAFKIWLRRLRIKLRWFK